MLLCLELGQRAFARLQLSLQVGRGFGAVVARLGRGGELCGERLVLGAQLGRGLLSGLLGRLCLGDLLGPLCGQFLLKFRAGLE